jgi:hypothetical protein
VDWPCAEGGRGVSTPIFRSLEQHLLDLRRDVDERGAIITSMHETVERIVARLAQDHESSQQALRLAIEHKHINNMIGTQFGVPTVVVKAPPQFVPPPSPTLRRLIHIADALPIPTRKTVKAMAGDYDDEVRRLRAEGRVRMAQWNVCLAWGCALRIVCRSPFD